MNNLNIENTILSNLLYNEDYSRKVIVFLKNDYFQSNTDKIVFEEIQKFYSKYNAMPSKPALALALDSRDDLSSTDYEESSHVVEMLVKEDTNNEWLVDETEKFCKDKAVYNAIMESISIIDGDDKEHTQGAIPGLLSTALAVSFDTHIGHDFLDNAEERYEFYQRKEERIPFDIEYLNKITKGGIPRKTLNILMAGTGVGKTIGMCHMAAANLTTGHNVLYITAEMAEERIAERIDANLMDVEVDSLKDLSFERYSKKIANIQAKTKGKLIVKEYPTSTAHAGHFRHLLKELALKKNFMPDIIYIDYLNICASQRLSGAQNVNSYTYVKAIAEELRGLAVEYNVPIWSATQVNRTGFSSSDMGLEDTSESFGLPATADLFLALIQTEELQELNQVMVKQLKNRYGDENLNKRFVIGINKSKMKWYDVEQDAQTDIMGDSIEDDKPESVFAAAKKGRKNVFKDFKV